MWTTEHSVETAATPERIWELWADVPTWPERNADLERAELSGPFAAGSTITMFAAGDDPIELTITEAAPPERFVDQADLCEAVVRTIHRLDRVGDDRIHVTYRMEIAGPQGDSLGPEIGPQISADFPDVIRALVAQAERR
jgi:hypothetical protein